MKTAKRIISPFLTLVVLTLLVISITGGAVSAEEFSQNEIVSDVVFSINGATLDADLLKSEKYANEFILSSASSKLNIPTTVQKYDLVAFDMDQMSSLSKKSMPVIINGKEFEFVLERLNFEIIDDGIDSYVGHVKGLEGSNVQFTFDESMGKEIVHGYIQLADETIYIVPVMSRADGLKTNYPLHAVYSSKDVTTPEMNQDEFISSTLVTPSMCEVSLVPPASAEHLSIEIMEDVQTRASEYDWATVTVLVATDNEFYSSETNWVSSAQSYMSHLVSLYQRDDIGVYLTIVSYDASKRNILSADSRKTTDPLNLFRDTFPASYLTTKNADIAIYLGGNDNDGSAQGRAWQYNESYSTYSGYAWCQMIADGNSLLGFIYDGSYYARLYCIMHEVGHVFNAHHELNWTEIGTATRTNVAYSWYDAILGTRQTVMWSAYFPDRVSLEYSSPSYNGDSTHNNAGAIRAVKHHVAAYR